MDGGEANLRLKGGLNLPDSSDPASLYVSFPLSQGYTFPPSVSLPPLRRSAANALPRPWCRHTSTEFSEPKPWRSAVNSELSQRDAGGNGDTHLGLVSVSFLILSLNPSPHLSCACHKTSRWLPDLQQEICIKKTQEEPPDGSSCCWRPVVGRGFLYLLTLAVTKFHKIGTTSNLQAQICSATPVRGGELS